MNIVTATSTNQKPESAAGQIQAAMGNLNPGLVIFFASSSYEPDAISQAMQRAFPGAVTFGCSTAGEISSGQMLKNSVVAMGFGSKALRGLDVRVVTDIRNASRVDDAFAGFEKHFGVNPFDMSVDEYVGLILVDGLRGAEENLMDRIGELTNVFFIGGSAGDDLKFAQTYVYANGKAYTDAALLALLKPAMPFSFIKTQSFKPCQARLVATKVREAERMVIEFNHKPAALAYAEAIGTTVAEAEKFFMVNPVGLFVDDEPYVRSPQRIQDQKMLFYCTVLEGVELTLLESTDIVTDTRAAVAEKQREMGHISGIINFHCILRTLELEKKGLTAEYAKLFDAVPTIGFSTYGEEFLGHINQTSTMLVFG